MNEFQNYVGCKIIQAVPMDEKEFTESVKLENFDKNLEPRDGYLVVYPDGYQSWSHKDVFENAYRPVTDQEINLLNE